MEKGTEDIEVFRRRALTHGNTVQQGIETHTEDIR